MVECLKLVSIIIPVYNLINHVEYCVKSVLAQTYRNIEIILVDDGSKDGSSGLCDLLMKKDSRIKVIHQRNGGVSAARNAGIENACGEYIMFVDGDDIISPVAVEALVHDMLKNDSILSGFGHTIINSYQYSFSDILSSKVNTYNSDDVLRDMLLRKYIYISVWSKVFIKSLVNDLRFIDGKGENEDKFFLFQYLMRNNGIVTQRPDALYGYFARKGSVTKSPFSRRMLDVIYFSDRILSEVKSNKKELIEAAEYNDVVTRLSVLKAIVRSKAYKNEKGTFTSIKRKLFTDYRLKKTDFYQQYKAEVIILRISDYLYILCVYLFSWVKKAKILEDWCSSSK